VNAKNKKVAELLSKEKYLNDAALEFDKRVIGLKEERMERLERILSDVKWLLREYETQMECARNYRDKTLSELYDVRETISQTRKKRRGKHEKTM